MSVLSPSIALVYPGAEVAMNFAISVVTSVLPAVGLLLVAMMAERRLPNARPPSSSHGWFNVRYTMAMLTLFSTFSPLLLGIPLAITRALGIGWISFAPGAIGWLCAFVAVLVMTDLLEYLFHRAQHRFSFMWKMHELHHSAEFYDVTLTYRHFWIEPLLKTAFLYPLIGVVFKAPPSVVTVVGMLFFINHHVAHLNLRYSKSWFSIFISHPQYHRLHHSRHERDYNQNYCDLLPLWDLLFRTFHMPVPREFVDVGLDSGAAPRTLVQALTWPWYRTLILNRDKTTANGTAQTVPTTNQLADRDVAREDDEAPCPARPMVRGR